jgi:hypothetical protein
LIGLRIFHIVDVPRILESRSPRHFSITLSCFISFNNSFAVIVIRQNVLFKFMESSSIVLGFFLSNVKLLVLESDP